MAEMVHPQFLRSDSSCLNGVDAAETLLNALTYGDLALFAATLPSAETHQIDKFHVSHVCTLLTKATERGQTDFVRLLLEHGANVNLENAVRRVSAIHLAALNVDADTISVLLEHGADVNCRRSGADQAGKTPLLVLISTWRKNGIPDASDTASERQKDRWWRCLDALISHRDIDLNAEDSGGTTPLELAVRKELRPLAEKLLVAGAIVNDHVREALQESTMADLLDKYGQSNPNSGANNNATLHDAATMARERWNALECHDVDRFRALMANNVVANDLNKAAIGRTTLLQLSCRREMVECVELLLQAGCDPNATSASDVTPPLIIAAHGGNVRILDALLGHPKIQLNLVDSGQSKQTALHKVAQKLGFDNNRYLQCLNLLLGPHSHGRTIDVNATDAMGNTALHYAAHSGVEEAVLQLLRHGSYLGLKNVIGETAVGRILPATLESYFDSCVQLNEQQRSSRDLAITFNYSFLAPPNRSSPSEAVALTNNGSERVIFYDAEPTDESPGSTESEALWHMSTSADHKYLLKHPLVTSFLLLKWEIISFYYYMNVIIYTLAIAVLTTYMMLLNSQDQTESNIDQDLLNSLWGFLVGFVTVLWMRELFQLGIAPLRYVFSLENYIEIGMLSCTVHVLRHWDEPHQYRHLSAVAILLGWVEFLLLFGRHPRVSRFTTMFTTVCRAFFFLLLWYAVLLIGFGFSFYLVFQSPTTVAVAANAANATNETDQCPADDQNVTSDFNELAYTLLKVSTMMTGELDYSALPFDTNPVTSRLIYLAFLFLITIVLLNLLTGMAVSDIDAIQSKAETIAYESLVELISYMESMLLGDPFNFLADYPPFSWTRDTPPWLRRPVANLLQGYWFRKLILHKRIALFQCLPNKTFTAFPNRKTGQSSIDPVQARDLPMIPRICRCHARFTLSKDIVQNTYDRLLNQKPSDPLPALQQELRELKIHISQQQNSQHLTLLREELCDLKTNFSQQQNSQHLTPIQEELRELKAMVQVLQEQNSQLTQLILKHADH